MKPLSGKRFGWFLGLLLLSFLMGSWRIAPEPVLKLKVWPIKSNARVFVSVCTQPDQWPDKGLFKLISEPQPKGTQAVLEIPNIPKGKVALAVFLDVNGNGRLDQNFFGIPTEPYAFSNNIRPTISAPGFEECSFLFFQDAQEVSVNLR